MLPPVSSGTLLFCLISLLRESARAATPTPVSCHHHLIKLNKKYGFERVGSGVFLEAKHKNQGDRDKGGGKACVISILIRIETVFTIRSHLQPLPDVVLFPHTELMNSIRHFSSFFFCLLSLLYTNANFLFRSRRRRLAHVIIWITCSFSFLTCKLTSRELTFC